MRVTIVWFGVFVFVGTCFAQSSEVPAAAGMGAAGLTALAMTINTGGVFFLVNLITSMAPALRRRAPQWIPIIAMASGPLLNAAGAVLSDAFGYPIDFSPVIGAFGGTAAVAAHQFGTQRRRARTRP